MNLTSVQDWSGKETKHQRWKCFGGEKRQLEAGGEKVYTENSCITARKVAVVFTPTPAVH